MVHVLGWKFRNVDTYLNAKIFYQLENAGYVLFINRFLWNFRIEK